MARRRTRRYYTNPKPSKSAGMSDGAKIAIALAGVAVVGGVGWYLYNQSQNPAAAGGGAGGGTISSGNQPYQLGTATSTGMPAAGTSTDGTTIVGSTAYGPGYSAANQPAATDAGEV